MIAGLVLLGAVALIEAWCVVMVWRHRFDPPNERRSNDG